MLRFWIQIQELEFHSVWTFSHEKNTSCSKELTIVENIIEIKDNFTIYLQTAEFCASKSGFNFFLKMLDASPERIR
jgi:hypothetical protein